MADVALEALWKTVLDRWDEDRTHQAFLEYCRTTDQLAEAAARYRGMKGDRDRSQLAEKRLAGVAIIALAQLEATRSRSPRGRGIRERSRLDGRYGLILAGAFCGAALALLGYLMASR